MKKQDMLPLKKIALLIKQALHAFRVDNASTFGASLAYYSVFSLAPLLVIGVGIAAIVFGSSAAEEKILSIFSNIFGTDGGEAIRGFMNATDDASQGGVVSVLGFLALLFGAGAVFRELQDALNHIFGAPPSRRGFIGFILKNFLSFGMVLAAGFLLLISLLFSVTIALFFSFLSNSPDQIPWLVESLNFSLSFLIAWGLFTLIFRYVPSCRLPWRDTLFGGGVTAGLFTIGKSLIGYYLGHTGIASSYGAAGSVVLILLWVYYSSQILLFGAEIVALRAQLNGEKTTLFRSKGSEK